MFLPLPSKHLDKLTRKKWKFGLSLLLQDFLLFIITMIPFFL